MWKFLVLTFKLLVPTSPCLLSLKPHSQPYLPKCTVLHDWDLDWILRLHPLLSPPQDRQPGTAVASINGRDNQNPARLPSHNRKCWTPTPLLRVPAPRTLCTTCVWFLHHVTRDFFFHLLVNLSVQPISSLLPVKYLTLFYLSQAAPDGAPYPQVLPGKLFFPT